MECPFRCSERTFRTTERAFRTLERTFRTTERRFLLAVIIGGTAPSPYPHRKNFFLLVWVRRGRRTSY